MLLLLGQRCFKCKAELWYGLSVLHSAQDLSEASSQSSFSSEDIKVSYAREHTLPDWTKL